NPMDVPSSVLAQLGLKIQHALRAFTANDRKAIKMSAENYPISEYYKTDEVLTSLGIGEAFVTALNEKGIPTPLVATMLRAPMSRIDVISSAENSVCNTKSKIANTYNEVIDREIAYEILNKKIEQAQVIATKEEEKKQKEKEAKRTSRSSSSTSNTVTTGI